MSPIAARNVAAQITFTPGTVINRRASAERSAAPAISRSTAAISRSRELDVAQRAVERLRLLHRQLQLAKPLATLDPEQVRHRRAALQAPHQHRVDLVLGARPRPHQLLTPRQPPAHHPAGRVGHPHRIELARRQQPRQRARVEPVGLRPRPADARVVRTHHHHPEHVRLDDPGDLPGVAGHLERHPIVRAQALREQLEPLRRRLDPPRRAHHPRLADRDLTEIAMHV
jgi:hypothetical protein